MKFQFDSMAAFFAMNGHGVYVWVAYGVSLFVLAWLVVQALAKHSAILKTVREAEHRPGGKRQKLTPKEGAR